MRLERNEILEKQTGLQLNPRKILPQDASPVSVVDILATWSTPILSASSVASV